MDEIFTFISSKYDFLYEKYNNVDILRKISKTKNYSIDQIQIIIYSKYNYEIYFTIEYSKLDEQIYLCSNFYFDYCTLKNKFIYNNKFLNIEDLFKEIILYVENEQPIFDKEMIDYNK